MNLLLKQLRERTSMSREAFLRREIGAIIFHSLTAMKDASNNSVETAISVVSCLCLDRASEAVYEEEVEYCRPPSLLRLLQPFI